MPSPIQLRTFCSHSQSHLQRTSAFSGNHQLKIEQHFEKPASPRVAIVARCHSLSPRLKPPTRCSSNHKMGRKVGTVYINPKKFGTFHKPCMKEMIAFLNCMATNQLCDDKCVKQKELLGTCMEAQSNKNRKSMGSINYHLQRLSRGRK